MKDHYEVVVVGGGIIGHAISYHLNKNNVTTLVVEKQQSGRKATKAAAGMLGVHTENNNANEFYKFCQSSRDMYQELNWELYQLTSIDIQLASGGMVELAFHEQEKQAMELKRQAFPNIEWVDQRQLKAWFPMLGKEAIAGIYMETDGHVEPSRVCEAFKQGAIAKGGKVKEDCHVWNINHVAKIFHLDTDEGLITAERVVIATGAESGRWFTAMGLVNPMIPVKGECLSVISSGIQLKQTLFCKDFYLVPKRDGRYVIGATSERYNQSSYVSVGGIESLLTHFNTIFPSFRDARIDSFLTGVRPGTEDGIPVIGEHPYLPGLYYATGHYRNGVLLAPATAKLIGDLIMNQSQKAIENLVSPQRLAMVNS